jgi:hypothetical protein
MVLTARATQQNDDWSRLEAGPNGCTSARIQKAAGKSPQDEVDEAVHKITREHE